MNSSSENPIHFLDYLRVVKVHKFVVLTVLLLVSASTTIYTLNAPKQYVALARLNVESDRPSVSLIRGEAGGIDMMTFNTESEIIQSKEVLYPVIDQLKLQQVWAKRRGLPDALPRDSAHALLRAGLKLSPVRGSTIVEIRFWSQDRNEAAEIANAIADAYEKYRLDEKAGEIKRGVDKIQEEYEKQKEEVRKASDHVEQLRKELKITDTGGMLQGVPREEQERVRQKEAQLLEAEIALRTQKLRMEKLSQLPLPELKNAINFLQPEASILTLISQTMDIERRLEELKSSALGPNHPDFKQAKATHDTLKTQLDGQLRGVMDALKIAVEEQEQKVKILEEDMAKLKEREQESHHTKYVPFVEAMRNLETQRQVMETVYSRLKQEGMEKELPRRPVRVIDRAESPRAPAKPNVPLNITLGVVVGLVLGISLAFFIEYMDTSIHKVDDVEKYLKIPVLGVVPRDIKPLNQMEDETPYAEFYRVLRANIEFARKNTLGNSVTFCSGGAGEGKSTTLINTAIIYAQHGQNVLVVDSDVRRPSLHRVLGMDNNIGLTDIVLKGLSIEEVVRATSVPNLHFISSGNYDADALGILAMGRMRELIDSLTQRYDIVFFDSPPVLGISDAPILAREVNLAVLVIQFRRFPRQFVMRTQAALEKAGVRLLGAVLNQVKSDEDEYYYYNYDYYYGGQRTGKKKKSRENRSQRRR